MLEGKQRFLEQQKIFFLIKIVIYNSYLNFFLLAADWACIFQAVDSNQGNRCI